MHYLIIWKKEGTEERKKLDKYLGHSFGVPFMRKQQAVAVKHVDYPKAL